MVAPSSQVVDALNRYAELLAEFGPNSAEAVRFFEEHKGLDQFEENARSLYSLEKEDYDERAARQERSGRG